MDNDFKKKLKEIWTMKEQLSIISSGEPISIRKQSELLSVSRSSLHYNPVGEQPENLDLME